MNEKNLSAEAIQTAITRLSDPTVNFRLDLASTPHVAKRIIQTLPGVKELSENRPEVAEALLIWLQDERTLENENFASICLHILENYPSERVKLALAKPISERRFTGFNSQFAADTFLKAAGLETLAEDAIAVARREARKIQARSPSEVRIEKKRLPKLNPKLNRKKSLAVKK